MKVSLAQIMKPWSSSGPGNLSVVAGAANGVGSAISPLGSLRAAWLAIQAGITAGLRSFTVYVSGDFTAEVLPTLTLPASGTVVVNVIGTVGTVLPAMAVSGAATFLLSTQFCVGLRFSGTVNSYLSVLYGSMSRIDGGPNFMGIQATIGDGMAHVLDVGSFLSYSARVSSRMTTTGAIDMYGGEVSATNKIISTTAARVNMFGTKLPAAALEVEFADSAGVLNLDSVSAYYWAAATPTITNGARVLIGNFTP